MSWRAEPSGVRLVGVTLVDHLPLSSLVDPDGYRLRRVGERDAAAIRQLLRTEPDLRMVVASIGRPLRWLTGTELFEFWKRSARRRIGPIGSGCRLEDFPGEQFYWASQWSADGPPGPVVLLEHAH